MTMRHTGHAALVGAAFLLAACQSGPGSAPPPPPAPPPPQATTCEASGATWAVGQHATDRVVERARMAAGARTARVLRPGEAVTMEFNAERLNLEVNEREIVQNVRCG